MEKGYLLYLMCHGKAVKGMGTDDFKRLLSPDGVRKIQKQLKSFKKSSLIRPDCILCSTAKRATETAALISELFMGAPCFYRDSLYLAPAFRICDILKEMDDVFQRIMIIAHQRGLEQVASLLAEKPISQKIKYGEMICLQLPIKNWSSLKPGIGKIIL